MATQKGTVTLLNKWGVALLEVHIRHRIGNDPMREHSDSFYCIPANGYTPPLDIWYEQNALSDYDYWWIKFVTLGGEEWATNKPNFWCNIAEKDDGNVLIKIDTDAKKMYLSFSASYGCSQTLEKC